MIKIFWGPSGLVEDLSTFPSTQVRWLPSARGSNINILLGFGCQSSRAHTQTHIKIKLKLKLNTFGLKSTSIITLSINLESGTDSLMEMTTF